MITITKLQVNTVTNNLVISATDNTDSYRFSKIMIDSSKTFNCKSEESTKAVSIQINDIEENHDLVDYKIPFNDIYNVENPESDLFFVWVYADDYKDYLGYLYGETIYFTDGYDNYYYINNGDLSSEEVQNSTEEAYNAAKQASEMIVKSYKYDGKTYIKYYGNTEETYYLFVDGETNLTTIEAEEYNRNRSTQVPYPAFGLTLSVKDFYNLLLNNIEIQTKDSTHCNPSCSDVNFMLAWQGFNLAKTLQDYNQMIYYWKLLHGFNNTSSYTSCCNK